MNTQIVILVLFSCFHSFLAVDEHRNYTSTPKIEENLVSECQNTTDYRAYIKCLKREKRQHYGANSEKGACLDECFEEKCHTSACIRDCHARCRKRLIETYSKTVETSFDDDSGERRQPNITLNLHLTNLLPNDTTPCNRADNKTIIGSNNSTDDRERVVNITNMINNGNSGSAYPYVPQLLPRIIIDFNSPLTEGCPYPWPCYQQAQTVPSDCSLCGNPFLRQQCNPACSTDAQKNPPNYYAQNAYSRPPPDNYNRRY